MLLSTACIPAAETVHWYIWARDVWFRSPPLSLIKNGTMFLPPQVLRLSQVQTDAQQVRSIVVRMWAGQGFEQIMHAWFLGFGTLLPSVPWLILLITSQWLLKVAMVILLHICMKVVLTSKCYLELDPSPGDVIVLGAFLERDFAWTWMLWLF